MRARIALVVGFASLLVALGVVLSRAPLTIAGSNGVPAKLAISYINGGKTGCQGGGVLPGGTTAIRVSLSANIGPRVLVKVFSGSALLTEGERGTGWGIDETVTVPVRPLPQAAQYTRICTTLGPSVEAIQINGTIARNHSGAKISLLRMEYLHPGPSSWVSLVSPIAHRMGLAHAPSGSWVAYLVIATMVLVCALTIRLILKELA
jgi:hypothetical protein